MPNHNDSSQYDSRFLKMLESLGKYAVWFKRIAYCIAAAGLIYAAVRIGIILTRLNRNGWSFQNNSTQISVEEPDFDEALAAWSELDYPKAESLFRSSVASSDRKNGIGSLESAAINQKLGAMYLEMGKYNQAYECLNNAYVSFREQLGEKDGNTILALGQIAIYDIKSGNVEKGFATLNDLYDHATYFWYKIQIAQMLAQCNTELGNYEKAIEWYDVLGPLYYEFEIKNLERVNLLNDYGTLMITVGNYQEAVRSLSSAVTEWKELDLEEDITIANVYSNLAQAYAWCGDREQAIETHKKALAIKKGLFGENSIHVAMSYDAISVMFAAMHDTDSQKAYLETALGIAEKTVGENHMCTAVIYLDLGNYYQQEREMEQAVACHLKSLEIQKNILGQNSVNTILIYEAIANDYRELQMTDIGIENVDHAIEIAESLYGRENLYSAHSYITAAWLYADAGNCDKAMQLAKMAVDICDRQKSNAGITRPYAYQTVGYVSLKQNNPAIAVKYLSKAKTLYENISVQTTLEIATTLIFLSDAYQAESDGENSLLCLIEADELLVNCFGAEDQKEQIAARLHLLYDAENLNQSFDSWYHQRKTEYYEKQEDKQE